MSDGTAPGCGLQAPGSGSRVVARSPGRGWSRASARERPAVAIVGALPEELAGLEGGGRWAGLPVVTAVLGEGALRAARALEALIEREGPERILVVGVAGAVTSGLVPGHLVLASEVHDPSGRRRAPDRRLFRRALRALEGFPRFTPGTVLGQDSIVLEATHKEALGRDQPGHAVVDLESHALAAVAEAHGVPWLVLRAVSDAVSETLPSAIARARRPDGSTDRLGVALRAALEPASWPALWSLRRRLLACADVLADAVEEVVAGLAD